MRKIIAPTLIVLMLFASASLAEESFKIKEEAVKAENLGTLIETANLDAMHQIQLPGSRENHWLFYYITLQYQQRPFQILDLNVDTGRARVVDGVPARPGWQTSILHSNGKVFVATGGPGYLMSYDPQGGSSQSIGKLADSGAQCVIEGDDGAIYLGECTKGYVERYDPKTGAWENYGIIDDPGPPYYRYAYTLGSDGRYIYIAMGQNPWYLVIYDRVKKTQKIFWKDAKLQNVTVRRGRNGGWFASRTGPDGKKLWYRLQGERDPQPLPLDPGVLATQFFSHPTTLPRYEINLDEAIPYNTNGGQVKIRWRKSVADPWREATARVRIGPFDIKRLYPVSKNQFFGFTSFYGPMFTWQAQPPQVTILGKYPISLYDALFDAGEWFFAGYPSAIVRYNPRLPWNPSSRNPFPNPRLIKVPAPKAKYFFYMTKGADGNIYFGGQHERDSVGGSLVWFNPKTSLTGVLRQPFMKHSVSDLIAAEGGSKIVFSSYGVEKGLDGKIFIFDVPQKKLAGDFAPLPGVNDTGKILEVAPGVVIGVVAKTPKSIIYKADLTRRQVMWKKEVAGLAFGKVRGSDRRLILGPDGTVWLYVNDTICRLDPADGSLQEVFAAPPAGNLLFVGNDLYIYGGTELRKVSGILRTGEK